MAHRNNLPERMIWPLLKELMKQNDPNGSNKPDPNSQMRTQLFAFGILAFIGEEAVQVVFRKNFGAKGLSRWRIVLCFILFELIAITCFVTSQIKDALPIASPASSILSGFFYLILGIYVIRKGWSDWKEAQNNTQVHPHFAGESNLLSFLLKDGWSQSKVQYLAEPILVIAIGVLFCGINPFWGVPLIYCGISVWVCAVVEAIFSEPALNQYTKQNPQSGSNFD